MFFLKKRIENEINKELQKTKDKTLVAIKCFEKAYEYFLMGKTAKAYFYLSYYKKLIDYSKFFTIDNRSKNIPSLTLIIVAFDTGKMLIECIRSIKKNKNTDYEIIIVDNGKNNDVEKELKNMELLLIKTPKNLYPSEGRNIGVSFANGEIISFLDDDAFVSEYYIETIVNAFCKYDICGFRGKVLPKTKNKNNNSIGHYDLGNIPIPTIINTEGNCAFKRSVYKEIGGMNPLLFGHEGWEFSYRISEKYGINSLIYWPETIIFHDYAVTDIKLNKKDNRHKLMSDFIKKKYPKAKKYRNRIKEITNLKDKKELEKLIPRL